jgi:hypothetical protein
LVKFSIIHVVVWFQHNIKIFILIFKWPHLQLSLCMYSRGTNNVPYLIQIQNFNDGSFIIFCMCQTKWDCLWSYDLFNSLIKSSYLPYTGLPSSSSSGIWV